MTEKNNVALLKLALVMPAFFAMGFVDLVGIATNYVKQSFALSDSAANLLPSMVFFWFLVGAVPTGVLMNKIGRRKTVLISLGVTFAGLVLPMTAYTLPVMTAAFCLLGIGNTIMQVSLNPLISTMVSPAKLSGALTFGQFVKAIASFIAPILASFGAARFGSWLFLFPVFAIEALLAFLFLLKDSVAEDEMSGETSGFADCFALLRDPVVRLCFIGIVCHVGIDVGTNVSAPKILIEKTGLTLETAGFAASVYFLFRTIGCFTGSFALSKTGNRLFFAVGVLMIAAGCGLLFFGTQKPVLTAGVALIGFGNSNVFPIIFAQALLHLPARKNEASGLMIMGLVGGTLFPPVMGLASDWAQTQNAAIPVMAVGALYLLCLTPMIRTKAGEKNA